jgi:hypothetical protein
MSRVIRVKRVKRVTILSTRLTRGNRQPADTRIINPYIPTRQPSLMSNVVILFHFRRFVFASKTINKLLTVGSDV